MQNELFQIRKIVKLRSKSTSREIVKMQADRQLCDTEHIMSLTEFFTRFELHKLPDRSVFPLKFSQWGFHKLAINLNKRAKLLKLLG